MPFADITKPPKPLPSAKLEILKPGLSLQPPLTRLGSGPGLIVLTTPEAYDEQVTQRDDAPTAVLKWAEEGYAVIQVSATAIESSDIEAIFTEGVKALEQCDVCQPKDKIGLVCHSKQLWTAAAPALTKFPSIVASVLYVNEADVAGTGDGDGPLLRHVAGPTKQSFRKPGERTGKDYYYPSVRGRWFLAGDKDFDYMADSVAHTRNLEFLKPKMGGPYFDLEEIWEEHTYYEFADRSVEHTMSTMVQEPYVNHVPTLTGGIGRGNLSTFYRDNFIFNNSADTSLDLVSRTIGIDRVVDEFIFKFTHDRELDWLLPGVPPTHLKAELPFTAVVNIRGDRLYHEHISWDQGTALRQLGLLPEYLPFPHPLPEGVLSSKNAKVEYRVPVLGKETAEKLRNRKSVLSNEMFKYSVRERTV